MKRHLNTLYVTSQGGYLSTEGDTVVLHVDNEKKTSVPLHMLDGIVCIGRVSASPYLMEKCSARGVSISYLTENGRFLARVQGPVSGNVLLRRAQYRRSDDRGGAAALAATIVLAKVANCRTALRRAARDHPEIPCKKEVSQAIDALSRCIERLHRGGDDLPVIRGIEGDAAQNYFGVLDHLIVGQKDAFAFRCRTRRPPTDAVNALLSFVYTLATHDSCSALEAVGLDNQVGFLHEERPGRPSLALDLVEEFRAFLADRLVLTLINRRQVCQSGFTTVETGGVMMDEKTRRVVLIAYQERKREEITHPFLNDVVTVGMLIHLQALLLVRHLRGDLDGYPAFVWK